MSGTTKNKRNQIDWTPPATKPAKPPRPRRRGRPPLCAACMVGDCDRCVRAGCYHPHDRSVVRKVGVRVPMAGPSHDHREGS